MFDAPTNLPVEDILEKVDAAPKPGLGSGPPATPQIARPAAIRPVSAAAPVPLAAEETPSGGARRVVIFAVIAVAVLGVFGGAGYVLFGLAQKRQPANANANVPAANLVNANANANANANQNANLPAPVTTPPANVPTPTPIAPTLADTDADGLNDAQEVSLGTDPTKPDTDADGLTDFDEVRTWKTDPLNPDTDGDGYDDGAEVKNGYDPKGQGRLLLTP